MNVQSPSQQLVDLARAIAACLAALRPAPDATSQPLEHLLQAAERAAPRPFTAPAHAYSPLVGRAAQCGLRGPVGRIAGALLAVHDRLPWGYHYTPRTPAEDLADRVAFAELIGPDGPLHAPDCRAGFTVMAEHTIYPLHAHPAVELYLVISGHARWQTPGSDRSVPPGELVLHQSNQAHAMQTHGEPLLALWGWSGDLDAPAFFV